jgi:murein L,D-transpeptidase YafK
MKNVISTVLLILFTIVKIQAQNSILKSEQLKNKRVKYAYEILWPTLQSGVKSININPNNYDIYLRAFKSEKTIEVWLKNTGDNEYKLFKTYDICASSGELGPKRQEGDGQVPEGFYTIDLFNPTSNYYLSMRVSYPNQSDKILKTAKSAGGAIMIHGNCVTIGCLPITDEKIKELYILCLEAKNRNRTVRVDIFPAKLTNENLKKLVTSYSSYSNFWNSLKPVYDDFEQNRILKKIGVDAKGKYFLKEN